VLGQVSVDPTVTPVLNNGGWVFNAAELLALLGIVLTVAIVFGYMRLAPRFQTDEQTRRSVRVPRMQPDGEVRRPVKVIGTPIIVQPPVIAPAVAGDLLLPLPLRLRRHPPRPPLRRHPLRPPLRRHPLRPPLRRHPLRPLQQLPHPRRRPHPRKLPLRRMHRRPRRPPPPTRT
jgi:hypothetical protein